MISVNAHRIKEVYYNHGDNFRALEIRCTNESGITLFFDTMKELNILQNAITEAMNHMEEEHGEK